MLKQIFLIRMDILEIKRNNMKKVDILFLNP